MTTSQWISPSLLSISVAITPSRSTKCPLLLSPSARLYDPLLVDVHSYFIPSVVDNNETALPVCPGRSREGFGVAKQSIDSLNILRVPLPAFLGVFRRVWSQEPRNAMEGVPIIHSVQKTQSNNGTCKRPLRTRIIHVIRFDPAIDHFVDC